MVKRFFVELGGSPLDDVFTQSVCRGGITALPMYKHMPTTETADAEKLSAFHLMMSAGQGIVTCMQTLKERYVQEQKGAACTREG